MPISAKERAMLAERLRARDAAAALAALAEISTRGAVELRAAVFAQLSPARLAKAPDVVIEALKTLGDLGAVDLLDRAERELPPSYAGWVAVARQRLQPAR